jgi:hypothetical protein
MGMYSWVAEDSLGIKNGCATKLREWCEDKTIPPYLEGIEQSCKDEYLYRGSFAEITFEDNQAHVKFGEIIFGEEKFSMEKVSERHDGGGLPELPEREKLLRSL